MLRALLCVLFLGVAQAQTLRVLAHDSFSLDKNLVAAFERQNNLKLQIIKGGDAGEMVNKAILSRRAPIADVIFGFDNATLLKVLEADLLEPYASPALAEVRPELKLDATFRATPVDYGFVNLNFHRASLANQALPERLADLAKPEFAKMLVVSNPATSSPGLAFLIATIQAFGEDRYLGFWADLRKNGLRVERGWSEAYYTAFSQNGGDRPLVLSYSTSPAAEFFFAEGKLPEPPTGNLLLSNAFRQIEFVGIVKGTPNRAAARKFVDWLLSPAVQQSIPTQMWVFPARANTPLPEVFRFVPTVRLEPRFFPRLSAANIDRWIAEWTQVVLQGQDPQTLRR